MSQINAISHLLKRLLKQHSITYKVLAKQLKMSEANVKRIFSSENFTLQRLEQITGLMSLSLSDFFILLEQDSVFVSSLSIEQEQELVADLSLLLVAICIKDGWQFEDIIAYYCIDKLVLVQLLARLDKLKMITLLPGNRYKTLIAQDFKWQTNGPLEQFLSKEVISCFLNAGFNKANELRFYLNGSYSQSSIDILLTKLEQLKLDAARLNKQDAKLPLAHRHHLGLFTAMRPWELSLFKQMKR